MRRPGIDRILVLTGVCLVLIFSGFNLIGFKAISSRGLGREIEIRSESAEAAASEALLVTLGTLPIADPVAAFRFEPEPLEFDARAFYTEHELASYQERRTRDDLYRRISPPLALRWQDQAGGVLLEWNANPLNDAIQRDAAGDPLLKTGYRIYRWRVGEAPTVIATASLDQTRFMDPDLGSRGGRVFYSVLTVLEGRVGGRDTLIESERSDVLEVDLKESFELRLIDGTPDRVTVEVTVGAEANRTSARFEVASGDSIGTLSGIDGSGGDENLRTIDYRTGLTVVEISEVSDVRDQVIRHPKFNPDGSRESDDTGFLFREEVRKTPIQRLEVRCEGEGGKTRVLSIDRP